MSGGTKIVAFIVAGIFILFGCLCLLAATSAQQQQKGTAGGTFVVGLILIGIGLAIVFAIKMREPKPVQKVEVTQKIDLSGDVKLEEMKCRNCSAPLSKDSVVLKEGAIFVSCPYCKTSYQVEEAPKW
jgi:Na+/melibiose symporter-like transporter